MSHAASCGDATIGHNRIHLRAETRSAATLVGPLPWCQMSACGTFARHSTGESFAWGRSKPPIGGMGVEIPETRFAFERPDRPETILGGG
jgi:hypothetical protein